MKVKLLIGNAGTDRVFFNYGDDYSDVARVFVEDRSDWEEIDPTELPPLNRFVQEFNCEKERKTDGKFAFLLEFDQQISVKSAIAVIVEKQRKAHADYLAQMEKLRQERERKALEAKQKKNAKTLEEKRALLEQLKKELGG
jgi:hypothetical protein